MGPQGTPSGSSRSSHSRCRFVRTTSATIGSSVSRWRTRSAFLVNRGSAAHCGTPAASQNFANWPSLPTARMRWPSAQAKTS